MKRAIGALVGVAVIGLAMTLAVWAQPPGPEPGAERPRGGAFEPPRMPLMTALDANGDGAISADEIAKASEALKKLDKNNDGKLTRDELRPQFSGPGGGRDPMAPGRRAGAEPGGPGPRDNATRNGGARLESSTLPKDDAERKMVECLADINRKQGQMLNVPAQDGRLLRVLVESIDRPSVASYSRFRWASVRQSIAWANSLSSFCDCAAKSPAAYFRTYSFILR